MFHKGKRAAKCTFLISNIEIMIIRGNDCLILDSDVNLELKCFMQQGEIL